jgi:hypothetical protein
MGLPYCNLLTKEERRYDLILISPWTYYYWSLTLINKGSELGTEARRLNFRIRGFSGNVEQMQSVGSGLLLFLKESFQIHQFEKINNKRQES